MQCPVCRNSHGVGKLFEVIRSRKTTSMYFCNICSVEFRVQGEKVLVVNKIKENGCVKNIS